MVLLSVLKRRLHWLAGAPAPSAAAGGEGASPKGSAEGVASKQIKLLKALGISGSTAVAYGLTETYGGSYNPIPDKGRPFARYMPFALYGDHIYPRLNEIFNPENKMPWESSRAYVGWYPYWAGMIGAGALCAYLALRHEGIKGKKNLHQILIHAFTWGTIEDASAIISAPPMRDGVFKDPFPVDWYRYINSDLGKTYFAPLPYLHVPAFYLFTAALLTASLIYEGIKSHPQPHEIDLHLHGKREKIMKAAKIGVKYMLQIPGTIAFSEALRAALTGIAPGPIAGALAMVGGSLNLSWGIAEAAAGAKSKSAQVTINGLLDTGIGASQLAAIMALPPAGLATLALVGIKVVYNLRHPIAIGLKKIQGKVSNTLREAA